MTLAVHAREGSLFHGAPDRHDRLEPRQAHDWSSGRAVPDGEPAVFATHLPEVAIFMAVMPHAIGGDGWFGYELDANGIARFHATPFDATTARGYVHVLSREGFTGPVGADWRSPRAVTPVAIVEVTGADLPAIDHSSITARAWQRDRSRSPA